MMARASKGLDPNRETWHRVTERHSQVEWNQLEGRKGHKKVLGNAHYQRTDPG